MSATPRKVKFVLPKQIQGANMSQAICGQFNLRSALWQCGRAGYRYEDVLAELNRAVAMNAIPARGTQP